jgi:hypothetical protein
MEKKLEAITKWLKKLGLIVDNLKTELCLFYKRDTQPVKVSINGVKLSQRV